MPHYYHSASPASLFIYYYYFQPSLREHQWHGIFFPFQVSVSFNIVISWLSKVFIFLQPWHHIQEYENLVQWFCLTQCWFLLQLWTMDSITFTLCKNWGWRDPIGIYSYMWFYSQFLHMWRVSPTFLWDVFKVKTTENKLII